MELPLVLEHNGLPLPKGHIEMPETMSAKKDERFKMAPLSEYYEDLLKADAFLARNTLSAQARFILQSSLVEKKEKIHEGVTYLARRRNISSEEMWDKIQAGTAEETSKQELSELQDDDDDAD
jgi:hypothetical protein